MVVQKRTTTKIMRSYYLILGWCMNTIVNKYFMRVLILHVNIIVLFLGIRESF